MARGKSHVRGDAHDVQEFRDHRRAAIIAAIDRGRQALDSTPLGKTPAPRERRFKEIVLSVERPGWRPVRKLADGIGDPAPDGLAFVIVLRGEFVGACGTFLNGLVAIPLEHEVGGAPDVDLGYHIEQVARFRSPIV